MSVLSGLLTRQFVKPAKFKAGPSYQFDSSSTTSRSITLPRAPVRNELIVVMVFKSGPSTVPAISGFNRIDGGFLNGYGIWWFWKKSDGTEGTSLTITSNSTFVNAFATLWDGTGVEGGDFNVKLSAGNGGGVSITTTRSGIAMVTTVRWGSNTPGYTADASGWVTLDVNYDANAPSSIHMKTQAFAAGITIPTTAAGFLNSSTAAADIICNIF